MPTTNVLALSSVLPTSPWLQAGDGSVGEAAKDALEYQGTLPVEAAQSAAPTKANSRRPSSSSSFERGGVPALATLLVRHPACQSVCQGSAIACSMGVTEAFSIRQS